MTLIPMPIPSVREEDFNLIVADLGREHIAHDDPASITGSPLEKSVKLLLSAMKLDPVRFFIAITDPDEFTSDARVRLRRYAGRTSAALEIALLNRQEINIG